MTDPHIEQKAREVCEALVSELVQSCDGVELSGDELDDANEIIERYIAAAIQSAVLEEAKWWHMQRGHHGKNWCCERIEALTARGQKAKETK